MLHRAIKKAYNSSIAHLVLFSTKKSILFWYIEKYAERCIEKKHICAILEGVQIDWRMDQVSWCFRCGAQNCEK